MKEEFYIQCILKKDSSTTTGWIPEKHAIVGKVVALLDDDDGRDEGWRVAEAGAKLPADYVKEHERDYLRTRKATDI